MQMPMTCCIKSQKHKTCKGGSNFQKHIENKWLLVLYCDGKVKCPDVTTEEVRKSMEHKGYVVSGGVSQDPATQLWKSH